MKLFHHNSYCCQKILVLIVIHLKWHDFHDGDPVCTTWRPPKGNVSCHDLIFSSSGWDLFYKQQKLLGNWTGRSKRECQVLRTGAVCGIVRATGDRDITCRTDQQLPAPDDIRASLHEDRNCKNNSLFYSFSFGQQPLCAKNRNETERIIDRAFNKACNAFPNSWYRVAFWARYSVSFYCLENWVFDHTSSLTQSKYNLLN